jgi:hypothetical protein
VAVKEQVQALERLNGLSAYCWSSFYKNMLKKARLIEYDLPKDTWNSQFARQVGRNDKEHDTLADPVLIGHFTPRRSQRSEERFEVRERG